MRGPSPRPPGSVARTAVAQAARRVLDLEPVFPEDLGDPGGRLMLLEGRLRVGVDAVGEVDDLVPGALHGGRDPGLEIDVWLGGSNRGAVGHGSSGAMSVRGASRAAGRW